MTYLQIYTKYLQYLHSQVSTALTLRYTPTPLQKSTFDTYRFVLYCTVLYCAVPYCTILYCAVPYCTILYCPVPYCTVLHRFVLSPRDPAIPPAEKAATDSERKVTFLSLVPGRLYNITMWTVSQGVTSRPVERQDR